jgi:hypothetical protein
MLELWLDAVAVWRRPSFAQWLIGMGLVLIAGVLLFALGQSKASAAGNHVAKVDSCLQAAGSDLKRGELVYHEMAGRPCGCAAAN